MKTMHLAVRVLVVVSISAIVGTFVVPSSDGNPTPSSTPDSIASTIPLNEEESPSDQSLPDELAPLDQEPKAPLPPTHPHPDSPEQQQEPQSPENENDDRAWKDLTPKEKKQRARVRTTLKKWFGRIAFEDGRDGKPFTAPPVDDPYVIANATSEWIKGKKKRRVAIKILNEQRRQHGLPPLSGDREQDLADAKARAAAYSYPGVRAGHWVKQNVGNGRIIILEDNSLWKIHLLERLDASLWLPGSAIAVIPSPEYGYYRYLLINTSDGEMAHAQFRGKQN